MTATRLKPSLSLTAHESPVRLIAFDRQGKMVTADVDMQTVVWADRAPVVKLDYRSPNPRHRPLDRLRSAAFAPDGRTLFLACGSRLLAIDASDGREVWRYSAPEWWPFMVASPQSIAVDNQGYYVVSFDNGSFERFSPGFRRVYRHKDNDSPVWFSLDQQARKIVGCDGYHICVWNMESGHKVSRVPVEGHAFAFAYCSATGLAAIRDAGTVSVWNLLGTESGEQITVAPGPPLVTFDELGTRLAYASGSEVALRDLSTGQTYLLDGSQPRLVTLSFDSKGQLWTGHADGSIKLWPA